MRKYKSHSCVKMNVINYVKIIEIAFFSYKTHIFLILSIRNFSNLDLTDIITLYENQYSQNSDTTN